MVESIRHNDENEAGTLNLISAGPLNDENHIVSSK